MSDIIVPAFSRLLDASTSEVDLGIFEAIGEMCMHNNDVYFGELIELMLRYESRSSESVCYSRIIFIGVRCLQISSQG